MALQIERYTDQVRRWPPDGRHILAQFDSESVVVYQAYCPEIARYAVQHRALGGSAFSYSRMSWIKPNFLWMMYRSGWGEKPDQEATLALRISRTFFDELLSRAVLSSFDPAVHPSRDAWQAAVARSHVRLQWDPDHDPGGGKLARRALQLGLRGATLERFGKNELLDVCDLSEFVAEQRKVAQNEMDQLQTPVERVYTPSSEAAAANVGLDSWI